MTESPSNTRIARRPISIFLLLTAVIFLVDALFVLINLNASNRILETTLHSKSEELRANFDQALSLTYRNMMQLAMFIANDEEVQELFQKGKQAVEAEGGGPGGERADAYRKELYAHVAPSWSQLTRSYDVRQLHFHLGPGSLSYLRVHSPTKFGDRMDDLRHIIVDTNAELTPRTGFETGRVYSGLRAIVPFFAPRADGHEEHVGALEVGTSFSNIMHLFEDSNGSDQVAVLLNKQHVEEGMWPQAIERLFPPALRLDDYYVESMSEPRLLSLLPLVSRFGVIDELSTRIVKHQGDHYALTLFPLFDYQAQRTGGGPVGVIVIADNINDEVHANVATLHSNLIYSLLAFIVIELLLYYTIRLITQRLQQVIDDKVHHIEELNRYLSEQAISDSLTRLHNHRFFIERLGEEINKSQRSRQPLSLLMLDIDHFKDVNDHHGHQAGDQVLEALAEALRAHTRLGDEAGRYGGEEFSMVLTDSNLHQAMQLAQRLQESIRAMRVELPTGEILSVTVSIGLAQWDGEENIQQLIERADNALYAAKHHGRNRIEMAAQGE